MNWEMVEPVLTEMLEDGKAARKEVAKLQHSQAEIAQKLETIAVVLSRLEMSPKVPDHSALKNIIQLEMAKLKVSLEQPSKPAGQPKRFVLFPEHFNVQNFKIVFETVCKWTGILGGGFYLLYSLIAHWK